MIREIFAAAMLLASAVPAHAFCRTPESIISGYDHWQVEAKFYPLYGIEAEAALAAIDRIGPDDVPAGDAALVAIPAGDPVFFVYIFKGNCQISAVWMVRAYLNDIIGGDI